MCIKEKNRNRIKLTQWKKKLHINEKIFWVNINAEVLGFIALLLKEAYKNFQGQQLSWSIYSNC